MLVSMVSPSSASAIDIPNPLDVVPSLDPTQWAVEGFKSILGFLFGTSLDDLGRHLVALLLAVPLLSDHASFPKLNDYRSYVFGGAWGLLGLSFVWSSLRYWLASYSGSGGYEALVGFGRTVGAIAMLLVFVPAFDIISRAINAMTHALIAGSEIKDAGGASHSITAALSIDNVTGGGIAMLVTIAAIVMSIVLLVIKAIVTSLLAVLYIASPLAIALYPVEEVAFLLRSLLQSIFALLVFPVIWALCFATLSILPADAIFPSGGGDIINSIVSPLTTLATLVIAFRLPFKVLEIAGMQGSMAPGVTRGMKHLHTARQVVTSK